MSPEQVRGLPVDHHSDIFAYGVVLYEMVSGRRAFSGASSVEIMSAILKEDPAELPSSTPPLLRRVISRCLEKNPHERFDSVRDVAFALESLSTATDATGQSQPIASAPVKSHRLPLLAIGALALVAATTAVCYWWFDRPKPTPSLGNFMRLTREAGLTIDPALSPDGKLIAYASDRAGDGSLDIYVQQVSGGDPIRLTNDPAPDSEPSFSPDGSRIVFRSERDGGGLFTVPALGGEARGLTRERRHARYSPDGAYIAYWDGVAYALVSRLFVISADGGTTRQPVADMEAAAYPIWAPDGRHLIFAFLRNGKTSWWVVALDGAAAREIVWPGPAPLRLGPGVFSPDGTRLICAVSASVGWNYVQLPISTTAWRFTGPPQPLAAGLHGDSVISVASDGRFAYSTSIRSYNLYALPFDPERARPTGDLRQLTFDTALNWSPYLTPDGRKMAFLSDRHGPSTVWFRDLVSGRTTALTSGATTPITIAATGARGYVVLNREGSKAFFTGGNPRSLMWAPTAGGPPETVVELAGGLWDISPDSSTVLGSERGGMVAVNIDKRVKTLITRHPKFQTYNHYFSPDGRWIAFEARNKPDRNRIHILRYQPGRALAPSLFRLQPTNWCSA